MDKELMRKAVNTIWSIVYRATQTDLNFKQVSELRDALNTVERDWTESELFSGRATWICDAVRISGILSMLPQKPLQGTEQIINECDSLQRYLLTSN